MSAITTTTTATKTINPALYVEYATTLEQFNTTRATLDKIKSDGGRAFEGEEFRLWSRAMRRLQEMRPRGVPERWNRRRQSTAASVRFEYAREQFGILKATKEAIMSTLGGRAPTDAENAIFLQYLRAKDHLKTKRDILNAEKPHWPEMFASAPPPISKADKRAIDAMVRARAAQEAAR
jgi:hypothetical protein